MKKLIECFLCHRVQAEDKIEQAQIEWATNTTDTYRVCKDRDTCASLVLEERRLTAGAHR